MSARSFVDTNIWVYAHLDKAGDARCKMAWDLVTTSVGLVISTQVLAEYYVAMLRNDIKESVIQANLEQMAVACEVRAVTLVTVRKAWAIRRAMKYSYWDSQIVASALDAGCDAILTEDLQHGRRLEDALTVHNPFKG